MLKKFQEARNENKTKSCNEIVQNILFFEWMPKTCTSTLIENSWRKIIQIKKKKTFIIQCWILYSFNISIFFYSFLGGFLWNPIKLYLRFSNVVSNMKVRYFWINSECRMKIHLIPVRNEDTFQDIVSTIRRCIWRQTNMRWIQSKYQTDIIWLQYEETCENNFNAYDRHVWM